MASTAHDGDHPLILAAQRGDRAALDVLVSRHDKWVRHVVYATIGNSSMLDDVVQHVWTTAWRQIGTLADPARWKAWLYRMAKNAAIDAGLKTSRERKLRLSYGEADHAGPRNLNPAEALADAEEHQRVLSAIKGLPAIYREPFLLRHLEDWSYAQIGEALDLPVDTVETRLVRARRLLRETLSGRD